MKKKIRLVAFGFIVLLVAAGTFKYQLFDNPAETSARESVKTIDLPVKGMATMLDLGANECIPCKMMVPVMEKVEKKYQGKAAIVFIDVWKDKEPAKRFGIRAIPTQIFFDKEGKEVYRHEGFMGEEAIDQIFNKMGVR